MDNGKTILSLDAIEARRKALQKELADLEAAERVFRSLGESFAPAPDESKVERTLKKPPIKQMILLILRDSGERGETIQGVLSAIRRKWIPDYPRSNVPPKLSMYKSEGLLDLEAGYWKITEKGRKEII